MELCEKHADSRIILRFLLNSFCKLLDVWTVEEVTHILFLLRNVDLIHSKFACERAAHFTYYPLAIFLCNIVFSEL